MYGRLPSELLALPIFDFGVNMYVACVGSEQDAKEIDDAMKRR